jgi:radical SAM protein with 4Fe4S-binding SPASM domain
MGAFVVQSNVGLLEAINDKPLAISEENWMDGCIPAISGASPLTPDLQSYPLQGRHSLFYYPDFNLLTLNRHELDRVSVPRDFRETLYALFLGIRKLIAIKEAQKPPETLFVEPWKTCNLACTYCYADAGPSSNATKLDAGRLSDLATKYPFKRVLVFGGEPLVDRKYLGHLYHARQWDDFFFSTNGLLLNRPAAQELIGLPNVNFQISLEPSAWSHRVTADGEKQFDLLAAHVPKLGRSPANIRVTIPPDAPYLPIKSLVDQFAELLGSFRFNISYWPASGPVLAPWLASWLEESRDLLQEDTGDKYEGKLPGHHLTSFLVGTETTGFRFYNCNAALGSVAVSPDGRLHGCHELAQGNDAIPHGAEADVISSSDDPLAIDGVKRLNLARTWSDNMSNSTCSGCCARYFCGGMCFAEDAPRAACTFLRDAIPLVLTQMARYSSRKAMRLASRSEERFKYLLSKNEELAKEVRCDKWTRLVSGELPLVEAMGLAGRFLKH